MKKAYKSEKGKIELVWLPSRKAWAIKKFLKGSGWIVGRVIDGIEICRVIGGKADVVEQIEIIVSEEI